MKPRTKHWLDSSEYDLKVARNLLKALVVEVTDLNEPPHIHGSNRLAEIAKVADNLSNDQKEFLSELTRMQSATRYADELHTYRSYTRKIAEEYLSKTKAMHKWLKKKLMSAASSANS